MSFTRKVIAAAVSVSMSALWTSTASAQEAPERLERDTFKPNRALFLVGSGVFAASYVPAVGVAATSARDGDDWLYVPIAGPWIDLADRGGCGPNECGEEGIYKALLVSSGVAQLAGTALVVSSLIVPEVRTTRKPMVVPGTMGRGGAGLTVVGQF